MDSERAGLFTPVVDVTHRPFCGPTAISALTGVPIARIEKMLRRRRGGYRDRAGRRIPIKGTYAHEVLRVLRTLGCRVEKFSAPEPTFGRFVEDTRFMAAAFLVNVTDHWMATCRGTYCDTSSLGGPRPIEGYKKIARRVQRAWRVSAPSTPMYSLDDPIMAQREPKPRPDVKTVRAQKLAEQIARWEAKERRARNALKRLRPRLARYQRLGVSTEMA